MLVPNLQAYFNPYSLRDSLFGNFLKSGTMENSMKQSQEKLSVS